MKKLLVLSFTFLLLLGCQSKRDKVQDFVDMYNRSSEMMISPMIKSTKATSPDSNTVIIEVNTAFESSQMENDLVSKSLPELIVQAIKSERSGKELFESGVKFNLKVYSSDAKLIVDNTMHSKKQDSSAEFKSISSVNPNTNENLNRILEIFNKNLPIEDKSTGTKIVSITADTDNNIVYTSEITENFKTMLETDGADQMLKDEMLRSPQIRQIFSKTSVLGVNNLKYVYTDTEGKMIKEIILTKTDLK